MAYRKKKDEHKLDQCRITFSFTNNLHLLTYKSIRLWRSASEVPPNITSFIRHFKAISYGMAQVFFNFMENTKPSVINRHSLSKKVKKKLTNSPKMATDEWTND